MPPPHAIYKVSAAGWAACAKVSRTGLIDCIAGYHLNPWTCGIAKFNDILAQRLELPVVGIRSAELDRYKRPLLSLKMSEFSAEDALALGIVGEYVWRALEEARRRPTYLIEAVAGQREGAKAPQRAG